jgi:putative ABC transport system ATP-binding protein
LSSLIELNDLSKIYQTGTLAVSAITHINLLINAPEMVAIMGPSGSGKSTMMNILGLLDRPTSGTFLFNGQNTAEFNDDQLAEFRNQKVGFVFQAFFLLPRLNAQQNVALPLLYRGIHPTEAYKRALAIMEEIHIDHLYRNKSYEMSGGEQQRVAIARALIGNPEIILADEPTGALDSKTGQEIINIFVNLNKNDKKTIIIITHDLNIAKQCQRIITLRDGKIIDDKKHEN